MKEYYASIEQDPITGKVFASGPRLAASDIGSSYANPGEEITIISKQGTVYVYQYVGLGRVKTIKRISK